MRESEENRKKKNRRRRNREEEKIKDGKKITPLSLGEMRRKKSTKGNSGKSKEKKEQDQIALGPKLLCAPIKAQAQPLCAPATSKLQINSWALHLYQKGSAVFTRTWLSRPPAPGDSVRFHEHISNISQPVCLFIHLFILIFICE